MGTRDNYTTDQEALDALFALQKYARDLGVSLESLISALIRAQMVQHYGSQMTVKDMLEIRE